MVLEGYLSTCVGALIEWYACVLHATHVGGNTQPLAAVEVLPATFGGVTAVPWPGVLGAWREKAYWRTSCPKINNGLTFSAQPHGSSKNQR